MALLSLFTVLLVVNSALSARIAGFLTIGGSQYMNMRHTMEELASRGHEVQKHHHSNLHVFFLARGGSVPRNPNRKLHFTDVG